MTAKIFRNSMAVGISVFLLSVALFMGMLYQYSYKEQWQPKDILTTFRMYQMNLDGQNERVYKGYLEQSLNQSG